MGVKTQDITSGALSATYPAYYKEFQIRNLTPVDIIITEFDGTQSLLPSTGSIRSPEACVDVEFRRHVGMRSEPSEYGYKQLAISGTKTSIPFEEIRNAPYKLREHNIIISTMDHSYVAKEMLRESIYNPVIYENRTDEEILDPRLVFQVIDPANRWDQLYVNVFGQTIIVRAGKWSSVMPADEKPESSEQSPESGRLLCYLRYPSDYCQNTDVSNLVFEVSLENISKEEPIILPGGDVICVAETMESLREILGKKGTGRGQVPANLTSSRMVPKELFDAAQANFNKELERVREDAKVKIDTTITTKNNEIAKLQSKLDQVTREKEALEVQNNRWESLNKVTSSVKVTEAEQTEAINKARKEAAEAYKKEIDNTWAVIRIGASVVASVATFAITAYIKSSKK